MTTISQAIAQTDQIDRHFVGTIAFRSEECALPDGSKMALGIDGGHWVLIYQKPASHHFQAFNYNNYEKKIIVDDKEGGAEELKTFRQHVKYFFEHARQEELITLSPPKGPQ